MANDSLHAFFPFPLSALFLFFLSGPGFGLRPCAGLFRFPVPRLWPPAMRPGRPALASGHAPAQRSSYLPVGRYARPAAAMSHTPPPIIPVLHDYRFAIPHKSP